MLAPTFKRPAQGRRETLCLLPHHPHAERRSSPARPNNATRPATAPSSNASVLPLCSYLLRELSHEHYLVDDLLPGHLATESKRPPLTARSLRESCFRRVNPGKICDAHNRLSVCKARSPPFFGGTHSSQRCASRCPSLVFVCALVSASRELHSPCSSPPHLHIGGGD